MSEEQSTMPPQGHIRQMGMLDLRFAQTPEDLKGITGIEKVGMILIPEHLSTALATIPMKEVGAIVPIPQGDNVQVQSGQIRLSGESLAAGDAEAILVVVGQLFITTPVTQVGFKQVRVIGQMFAIRGSEGPLGAKLQIQGQSIYLPADPRLFMGEERLGRQFLELLPKPTPIVIMGKLTFAEDVTVELLQQKVPEIVLMGQICAPEALIPILQVLTVEKMGAISTIAECEAGDEEGEEEAQDQSEEASA
ncbi:MAG TPA: hypothetical protein VFB38_15420 [Chthonomonadaceae bacterium]|nr:hypothetical protein [Chthonomonadaceae bacterium]